MLLPRELDMVEAGKHTPLPLPKPAIPQEMASKDGAQAKTETGKPDDAKPTIRRTHQLPEPIAKRQAKLKPKPGT